LPILNGMAHSKSWHISKGIIKTIMVHKIVLKTLLFFAPTAELYWSCVPPAHQLLYLNCNCCSQFTYHVITQITVSHFVFFALSWKIAPPLARGGVHPPSKSIPVCIFSVTPLCNIILQCINIIHVWLFIYHLWLNFHFSKWKDQTERSGWLAGRTLLL
jgi:hypothetical protein